MSIHAQKVYILYVSLDSKDRKSVKVVIKNHKRKRLYELLKIIEKAEKKPDTEFTKQEVFAKLFKEKFETSKDYLLRNEYRLFSNLLEDYLVEDALQRAKEENPNLKNLYLCKALFERSNHELIAKIVDRSIELAESSYDFTIAYELAYIKFMSKLSSAPRDKLINESNETLSLMQNQLNKSHWYSSHENRSLLAYNDSRFRRETDFMSILSEDPRTYTEEEVTFVGYEYFKKKTNCYLVPHGDEKIQLLEELSILLPECMKANTKRFLKEHEYCFLSLALEYGLKGEYIKAESNYEIYFKDFTIENSKLFLPALYNFCNNQIKLEKYQQVASLLEVNKTFYMEDVRLKGFYKTVLMSAELMLGNVEKLRTMLPKNINTLPRLEYIYYRFIYCALFYLEDNLFLAEREASNFMAVLRDTNENKEYDQMAAFFKRFFKIQYNQTKKGLVKLQVDLEKTSAEFIPSFRDYIPFVWLKREIKERVQKKG